MVNWHKDCFAGDWTYVHMIKHCEVCRLTYYDWCLAWNEVYWIPTSILFWNSKFWNRNSDFLIFQQQNSTKNSDRNLWNQTWNWNSASDGGPRNWNQKLEFPTKAMPTGQTVACPPRWQHPQWKHRHPPAWSSTQAWLSKLALRGGIWPNPLIERLEFILKG